MNELSTARPLRASLSEELLLGTFQEVRESLIGALARMLGSNADAQDAAQTAFLNCWKARSRLPEITRLRSWIWRVGLNAGRDVLASAWRRRGKPGGYGLTLRIDYAHI